MHRRNVQIGGLIRDLYIINNVEWGINCLQYSSEQVTEISLHGTNRIYELLCHL